VIELSAGGWRTALGAFRVVPNEARLQVDETWNAGAFRRWRPFGTPKPTLERDGGRRVLLNNGDGNYFSGVYLKRTFNARSGLAFDFETSIPITATQGQILIAGFIAPGGDDLRSWDHVTGYIAPYLDDRFSCTFHFPAGEGKEAVSPWWSASMHRALRNASFRLETGEWHKVRAQVLPDGRCGLAIDGQAVYLVPAKGPFTPPALAVTQGNMSGTRILIGRVQIRSGVPDDVDWKVLSYVGDRWIRLH
jgi:hypothetical protein